MAWGTTTGGDGTEPPTVGPVGPGFEFTPEQIDLQLSRCSQLLGELAVDMQGVQAAQMSVHPPAPDAASVEQANAVKRLLDQTGSSFQAGIDFLSDWQAKLTAAKASYMQTEQLTTDQWSRLSSGIEA